jgi:3-oxoacyl-[acyl-carrier protein] reductase
VRCVDDLSGRVALVTGGDRGIGRAIALALGRAGAAIGVHYHSHTEDAAAVCAELDGLGRRGFAVQADLATATDAAGLVKLVERELGGVEILVNNAGIAEPQTLEELTEADWDRHIAVNLTAAFLLTQAVLPGFRARHWGRIINLSSTAAQVGGIVGPHYAAAKAGLLGLTHAYAALLAKEGITVNAIAPALIETQMLANLPKAQPERIPVGRFGTVEEVAEVALMLASNGYVTGQTIQVNGGAYMT